MHGARKALDLLTEHRAQAGLIAQESGLPPRKVEALMEAVANVKGALSCLERGEPESAVWRLVDAAGTLADHFPVSEGDTAFTGLGYRLQRDGRPLPDPKQMELFPS